MPQQGNDTLMSLGTADANTTVWMAQMVAMVRELQQNGHPGVQAILDKYGFQTADFGTTMAKIRNPQRTGFVG